ncbi:MAG: Fe-S cluster assembly protein SufD [Myxococcota bacterium]
MSGPSRSRASRLAEGWVAGFPAFLASSSSDASLRGMRTEALAAFQQQGLPHRKLENWRHTPLTAIEDASPEPPTGVPARTESDLRSSLASLAGPGEEFERAVFVDGQLNDGLSSLRDSDSGPSCRAFETAVADPIDGASLRALLGTLADPKRDAFTALGTAYMQGGAVVRLPTGCRADRPLHLLFVWTHRRSLQCPRILVLAESGSEAVVLAEHVSMGETDSLTNSVSELFLAPGAQLDWVVVERPGESALRVSNLHCKQEKDSRLGLHMLSLGGRFARTDIAVRLADTGAEVDLNGLFLGTSDRLVDHHTEIDHAMPHGQSRQLYKGILAGHSRGVFRGMIRVSPHAQKTDSRLSNPNLLLSDTAQIETEPQLEIHADDVKCSHGSTVGQLDLEALFYLQTRGIGFDDACNILTRGFATEICDRLPHENLRRYARSLVSETLNAFSTGETRPEP